MRPPSSGRNTTLMTQLLFLLLQPDSFQFEFLAVAVETTDKIGVVGFSN